MELVASRPRLRDSIKARWAPRGLDLALAAGLSPESSPALAQHARRLTKLASRRAMADSLRVIISASQGQESASYLRIVPRGPHVLAAADELAELADALARPGPVCARGVARARLLLSEGTGPLHNPRSGAGLGPQAALALESLRPWPAGCSSDPTTPLHA